MRVVHSYMIQMMTKLTVLMLESEIIHGHHLLIDPTDKYFMKTKISSVRSVKFLQKWMI